MAKPWIDQSAIRQSLSSFFSDNKSSISSFGNTVNQCFEAYVFVSIINWYAENGWTVALVHPNGADGVARLKFNTRGRPNNYTYASCAKANGRLQVRHALRVATEHHQPGQKNDANIVLDVAVIRDANLASFTSGDHLDNSELITFAEAKHMPAFAELIAGFIGLVHEVDPMRLTKSRSRKPKRPTHLRPFLYVSGHILPTAKGIVETIQARGFELDVYDYTTELTNIKLPVKIVKSAKKPSKVKGTSGPAPA
jgi:hypothetical protein